MPSLSEEITSGSSNIMIDVLISSLEKKGYDVYLDDIYLGSDGKEGDELDGAYRLSITGNMNHSVIADDGNFTYGINDYYFSSGMPYVFSIDSPQIKLGPSNKSKDIKRQTKSYAYSQEQNVSPQYEPFKYESASQQITSNVPPLIETLTPDLQSPQEIGATISWRAQASDPENDPIYYKFLLKGPRTGDKWETVQDWSANSAYSWKAFENDIGKSLVSVQIRDGKHADKSSTDDLRNSTSYEIKAKQLTSLNVQVVNDVYTNEDRRVYYCQEGKYYYIRNRLYITGPDMDKVAKVKYILPQSFPNPEQVSEDTSKNFETWIFTWGKFNGVAIVTAKSGQTFEKEYYISFKDKVEAARSKGILFVQECN
jgi:hypothetical protein